MKEELQLLSHLRTESRQPFQLPAAEQHHDPQYRHYQQKKRKDNAKRKKFLFDGDPFLDTFQQRIAQRDQQKGQDKGSHQRKKKAEEKPHADTDHTHPDQLIVP